MLGFAVAPLSTQQPSPARQLKSGDDRPRRGVGDDKGAGPRIVREIVFEPGDELAAGERRQPGHRVGLDRDGPGRVDVQGRRAGIGRVDPGPHGIPVGQREPARRGGGDEPMEVQEWATHVHLLKQRLLLRRAAEDDVVISYAAVLEALASVGSAESDVAYETSVMGYEERMEAFLSTARAGLGAPVD